MGTVLSKDTEKLKRWWILVGIVILYVVIQFIKFVIWKIRNIRNKSAAAKMLRDRNS